MMEKGTFMGKEEITVIGPAVKAAEKMGIHAKAHSCRYSVLKTGF